MELTKEVETDSQKFIKKFKGKKYSIRTNAMGEIVKIISTDKEIIAYAKKLGLKNE